MENNNLQARLELKLKLLDAVNSEEEYLDTLQNIKELVEAELARHPPLENRITFSAKAEEQLLLREGMQIQQLKGGDWLKWKSI